MQVWSSQKYEGGVLLGIWASHQKYELDAVENMGWCYQKYNPNLLEMHPSTIKSMNFSCWEYEIRIESVNFNYRKCEFSLSESHNHVLKMLSVHVNYAGGSPEFFNFLEETIFEMKYVVIKVWNMSLSKRDISSLKWHNLIVWLSYTEDPRKIQLEPLDSKHISTIEQLGEPLLVEPNKPTEPNKIGRFCFVSLWIWFQFSNLFGFYQFWFSVFETERTNQLVFHCWRIDCLGGELNFGLVVCGWSWGNQFRLLHIGCTQ